MATPPYVVRQVLRCIVFGSIAMLGIVRAIAEEVGDVMQEDTRLTRIGTPWSIDALLQSRNAPPLP